MKKEKKLKSTKPKRNVKVIIYSIIALGCILLMYLIHWSFIIPAAILSWLNYRELIS